MNTLCRNTKARSGNHYTYQYPRPGLTVDTCIIARPSPGENPKVLLIQRKFEPFAGSWALPGGFVDEGEPLEAAAARELQEETSVDVATSVSLEQVGAFGDPGRDPRGWTVTVAYCAVVPSIDLGVQVRTKHCPHRNVPSTTLFVSQKNAFKFSVPSWPEFSFPSPSGSVETFNVIQEVQFSR
jgi:ADP-ribose pyrophosphatase YjhB (NUDIX family)